MKWSFRGNDGCARIHNKAGRPISIGRFWKRWNYACPRRLHVNSADDIDDGDIQNQHTSLREAINAANLDATQEHIAFNIPGIGVHTISRLPNCPCYAIR